MAHPESEPDWSPEKEQRDDRLLDKLAKRAEDLLDSLSKPLPAPPPRAYAFPVAQAHQPSQISVRRIENGFIMTYFEARPPMYLPPNCHPELAKKIFRPHQVEVFILGPNNGVDDFKKALESAEKLAESVKIMEQFQAAAEAEFAAAVDPEEETRRLERPTDQDRKA